MAKQEPVEEGVRPEFSEALSGLRRENNYSQRKAAEDLGVSQALLSHYENGLREPRFGFLVRACEYYNVTADYLLGRTIDKGKQSPSSVPEHVAELLSGINKRLSRWEHEDQDKAWEHIAHFLMYTMETIDGGNRDMFFETLLQLERAELFVKRDMYTPNQEEFSPQALSLREQIEQKIEIMRKAEKSELP